MIGLGNDPQRPKRANAVMAEGLDNLAHIHEQFDDDLMKTCILIVVQGKQQEP